MGLRTLVIAFKKISGEEFNEQICRVQKAREALGNGRAKCVERAYGKLEGGLTLLGVTALEDQLQENVPETIKNLRRAGIKVRLFLMKLLLFYMGQC